MTSSSIGTDFDAVSLPWVGKTAPPEADDAGLPQAFANPLWFHRAVVDRGPLDPFVATIRRDFDRQRRQTGRACAVMCSGNGAHGARGRGRTAAEIQPSASPISCPLRTGRRLYQRPRRAADRLVQWYEKA